MQSLTGVPPSPPPVPPDDEDEPPVPELEDVVPELEDIVPELEDIVVVEPPPVLFLLELHAPRLAAPTRQPTIVPAMSRAFFMSSSKNEF